MEGKAHREENKGISNEDIVMFVYARPEEFKMTVCLEQKNYSVQMLRVTPCVPLIPSRKAHKRLRSVRKITLARKMCFREKLITRL